MCVESSLGITTDQNKFLGAQIRLKKILCSLFRLLSADSHRSVPQCPKALGHRTNLALIQFR